MKTLYRETNGAFLPVKQVSDDDIDKGFELYLIAMNLQLIDAQMMSLESSPVFAWDQDGITAFGAKYGGRKNKEAELLCG